MGRHTARSPEHVRPFDEGVARHQPAHARADDGGMGGVAARTISLVDQRLQLVGQKAQIGVAGQHALGRSFDIGASLGRRHRVKPLREILAIARRARLIHADDDDRCDLSRRDEPQHGLVRRPHFVETRALAIEQILSVVHVNDAIAALAGVIAGRQPDRHAWRRDIRRWGRVDRDEAADIVRLGLGAQRHQKREQAQ